MTDATQENGLLELTPTILLPRPPALPLDRVPRAEIELPWPIHCPRIHPFGNSQAQKWKQKQHAGRCFNVHFLLLKDQKRLVCIKRRKALTKNS